MDPSVYDCSSTVAPTRTTKVPASCATDRTCAERLVAGHRAMGGDIGVIAPENTVGAVRAAIAYGVDFIETDPRPAKDGTLVNVHDTEVDRIAMAEGEVASMTVAELQALPLKTAEYPGDWSCARIATMEEILLAARGNIHVLLDANKTSDMTPLVDLVHATDTLDWVILDTDSVDKIKAAIALEPKLHVQVRVDSEAALDEALAALADHPPVIIEINGDGLPKTLAPLIHGRGHRVFFNTFGVDIAGGLSGDISGYAAVFAEGVDVVQTDRPNLCRLLGR